MRVCFKIKKKILCLQFKNNLFSPHAQETIKLSHVDASTHFNIHIDVYVYKIHCQVFNSGIETKRNAQELWQK